MKPGTWVFLFALMLGSTAAHAKDSGRAEMESAIENLTRIRSALKKSANTCAAYDPPPKVACTFESYCGQMTGKAQDFYLFQDSEGHQVLNYQMMDYLNMAEACAPPEAFPQTVTQDPFAYPEMFLVEQAAGGAKKLRENQERLQKEVKRTQGLFNDAQERIVQLLQKKKTPGNRAEIENMISRIKSVRFETPDIKKNPSALVEYGCESANAYFDPESSSVKVCPQLMNLPDSTLLFTLAHELGHAIDPCRMSFGLAKTQRVVPEWMEPMTLPPGPVTTPAVSPSKNPFKSVIACLQSPQSIGAHIPTKEDLLKDIDMEFESLKGIAALDSAPGEEKFTDLDESNFTEQKKKINDHYADFLYCEELAGQKHMQEAFADWVGTEVVADKVSSISNPQKAREYAFASSAFFMGADCANLRQLLVTKIGTAVRNGCPDLAAKLESHANASDTLTELSHPTSARRVNKILFSHPTIQKALNCRPGDNGKECR